MLIAGVLLALAQERVPMPDAAKLKTAEAQVHDVYKPEYAKADRRAMAAEFLRVALETNDDPAARYVLFREATALATQSGDYPLGIAAIEELAKRFQVDGVALKLGFLTDAAKSATTPE